MSRNPLAVFDDAELLAEVSRRMRHRPDPYDVDDGDDDDGVPAWQIPVHVRAHGVHEVGRAATVRDVMLDVERESANRVRLSIYHQSQEVGTASITVEYDELVALLVAPGDLARVQRAVRRRQRLAT